MISVIGGEACGPEALETAEKVGREIARRGATLVCGGRGGVMEAACRGAREAGGHTIGIMPGRGHEDSPPNPYVEFPIFTGMGFARNVMVVLSGDAVIAIDGSYGTLSEIALRPDQRHAGGRHRHLGLQLPRLHRTREDTARHRPD